MSLAQRAREENRTRSGRYQTRETIRRLLLSSLSLPIILLSRATNKSTNCQIDLAANATRINEKSRPAELAAAAFAVMPRYKNVTSRQGEKLREGIYERSFGMAKISSTGAACGATRMRGPPIYRGPFLQTG